MCQRPGLIVIIIANVVAASELQCAINYLSEEKYQVGVVVFDADGDNQLNPYDALMDAGDLSWAVVNRTAARMGKICYTGNYLILGTGHEGEYTVKQAIKSLSKDPEKFQPSARTLVILSLETESTNFRKLASRVITVMWDYRVYDTVVIFVIEGVVEKIFSANPFDPENRCGTRAKRLLNLTCGDPIRSSPIWSHPKEYSQCILAVSRRDSPPFSFKTKDGWRGADQQFMKLIIERKNLSILWYERPSPESGLPMNRVHHYYDQIINHEIDLAIGGVIIVSKYMNKVQYLRPYDQHSLLFYVADAELIRGWKVLHYMFPTNVWCVLCAALFLGGLTYSVMLEGTLNLRRTKFLMLIAILVTQSMRLPKKWHLRLLMVTFLFPLYHISTLHSTALQSYMLQTPKDNSDIITEDDLKGANLTVYSSDVSRIFSSAARSHHMKLVTSTKPIEERLNELDRYRNFSILARSLDIKFQSFLKHYRIHSLNPGVTVLSVSMVIGRGHLYSYVLDELVQRCLEVGLFSKWIRDLTTIRVFRPKNKVINSERAEAPLDLTDLDCAFNILLVGLSVATVAFICEHLFYMWPRRSGAKDVMSK